jgi:hypothetical protein
MKNIILSLLLAVIWSTGAVAQLPQWGIGEYPADTSAQFRLCTPPPHTHYHFLPYGGGARAIHAYVKQRYQLVNTDQSGYLTVRGFLNCRNQLGSLRLLAVDTQYKPCTFDPNITQQLLTLTQQLTGWEVSHYQDGNVAEGYVSVVYKIKKGAVEYVVW